MVMPIIAGAAALFDIIGRVGDLFDTGKRVYEEVAGNPSAATSPDELKAEVGNLTEAQRNVWVDRMEAEVKLYQAQTDRLKAEEGELTPEMMTALGPEAASKVALSRMTTRPRIAWLSACVLATPMFAMWYDGAMLFWREVTRMWGSSWEPALLVGTYFAPGSLYKDIYTDAAQWSATIVLAYMLLRELGKSRDSGGSLGQQLGGLVTSVKGLFGGKR